MNIGEKTTQSERDGERGRERMRRIITRSVE